MAQQPLMVQGLHVIENSRSYSDIPHLLGLRWARDRSLEKRPLHDNYNTHERHPCPLRDSNSQYQQPRGRKPRGHWDRQCDTTGWTNNSALPKTDVLYKFLA